MGGGMGGGMERMVVCCLYRLQSVAIKKHSDHLNNRRLR